MNLVGLRNRKNSKLNNYVEIEKESNYTDQANKSEIILNGCSSNMVFGKINMKHNLSGYPPIYQKLIKMGVINMYDMNVYRAFQRLRKFLADYISCDIEDIVYVSTIDNGNYRHFFILTPVNQNWIEIYCLVNIKTGMHELRIDLGRLLLNLSPEDSSRMK